MSIILRRDPQITGMVDVVRSFSFKLNAGNYESRDFFCSQRCECRAEDAEAVSEKLYQFCKQQVMKSVAEFQKDQIRRTA